MTLVPFVLAVLSDALVSLQRISKFLEAEELAEPYAIDSSHENAIDADGDFTWETAEKPIDKIARKAVQREGGLSKGKDSPILPNTTTDAKQGLDEEKNSAEQPTDEKPFELKDIKFKVPKGAFVAIVGRVGSGKVLRSFSYHEMCLTGP